MESLKSRTTLQRRRKSRLSRVGSQIGCLIVPVRCAGCGIYDEKWCRDCRASWTGAGFRCERGAPRLDRYFEDRVLPVWALVRYDGVARMAILAAKVAGRHDLHRTMATRLGRAAQLRRNELNGGPGPVLVVPVPSSRGAIRERGADITRQLAEAVAQGCGGRLAPILRTTGRKRDQVGLGRAARRRNLAGSIRIISHPKPPSGAIAVLVDDIVTSGATLRQCQDVLDASGFRVAGAFVLAAVAS